MFDLSTIDYSKIEQLPYSRTTTEPLDDTTYFKKTEQIIHQKKTSQYFTAVLVEKYINDTPTQKWSWIQPIDKEELQEFIDYYKEHKPKKPPFNREQYYRDYYERHKEELKNKSKEYYNTVVKKRIEAEIYRKEHILEVKEKKRIRYLKRKEEKLNQ